MSYTEGQYGFLLHSRNLTDSKKIDSFFTRDFGRVSLVRRERKKTQAVSQFVLYQLSWRGQSELKTTQLCEVSEPQIHLAGNALFCSIYLNELLTRTLPLYQCHANLFDVYRETLIKNASVGEDISLLEVLLRRFEFFLLDVLGFAIDFYHDVDGKKIEPSSKLYIFRPEMGFVSHDNRPTKKPLIQVSGTEIDDIRSQHWNSKARQGAKKLTRSALALHLGGKPLLSRQLFS